jgi:hypothetical protein
MLGCFMFLEADTDLSWVEAQQKCESIGGYLAEPITARYSVDKKNTFEIEKRLIGKV